MRIPRLVPATAILLALTAPALYAQAAAKTQKNPQTPAPQASAPQGSAAQSPSPHLLDLDADHDGKVSRAEWKGNDVSFQMLDRNGDGVLSGDELGPAKPAPEDPAATAARLEAARVRQERIFRWMDLNHDGRVTKAEWRGEAGRFARLDRNKDGALTLEEYGKQPQP